LKGVDENLHKLKEAIDTAEPHSPELVCSILPKAADSSKRLTNFQDHPSHHSL
jgi:hypothetical protein